MVSSKMSIDSLLNPTTGHCKHSRCDCSCYHASEVWVSHSKYSSFESHTPPIDRLSYGGSLGVAKKCPIWPIVRTDRAIVRTHRTKGSWRKEPFHCPLSSCRQKFHSFRRLSSHFQKEHLPSSVDAAGKSYTCPVVTCSRRFSSSGWLWRHFNKLHELPPKEIRCVLPQSLGPTF